MNIKPILARLQNAIGSQELIERMVLLPEPLTSNEHNKSKKTVNLVVGYNSSSSSQSALDLALLIAHQTRLATHKQVTVHVVYVLNEQDNKLSNVHKLIDKNNSGVASNYLAAGSTLMCAKPVLNLTRSQMLPIHLNMRSVDSLEQADQILWKARCLAEEWGETFISHLRFGCVATQLKAVVESEAATLLFLGCNCAADPLVQELGFNFPCSVLGIPMVHSLEKCTN